MVIEKSKKTTEQVETLDSEVKKYANGLSYWTKYLVEKILSGKAISDNDNDIAYSYLLEELALIPSTEKPEIDINYNANTLGSYKLDLLFTKLEGVEGVNALIEDQVIEFNPNATIIYGSNGSGKSGYVRLMKKVFYSKAPEEIIKNIYLENGHKPVSAKFTFKSGSSNIQFNYPENAAEAAFQQFAIFDDKSVLRHLDQRNEFEFRPAGLSFFADFTEAIKRVELKLDTEIAHKQSENNFTYLFDGESEIKSAIQNLTAQTNITDLKKYLPYSKADKSERYEIEKKYDELLLASKNKDKEIITLENNKQHLISKKQQSENLNQYFDAEYLSQIQSSITECVNKEAVARAEGIENFKTSKIQGIGTTEWKNFIVAAEQFAKKQELEYGIYPGNDDNCLLCQQPLSNDAQNLISNYWAFIKSVAEQNAKKAVVQLDLVKEGFEKLNLDLFPAENALTLWLTEKHPQFLISLQQSLSDQKTLAVSLISDITSKTANKRAGIKIDVSEYDNIILTIDASIKTLREGEQSVELNKLLKAKTYPAHKEKLELHLSKIEKYLSNQQWIAKAKRINWVQLKRNTTDWEKYLSGKYFNQKYIDTFNKECLELKGDFGITIDSKSSHGRSNRQLLIKGNTLSSILSEGEQKVIAIADFLSEMQLSEVNRGIIFDDPVNSLDEAWKSEIAHRLVKEASSKQVILFTHDLVFVSSLITACEEFKIQFDCHWIEKLDGKPGTVWLKNTPTFEKSYKKSGKAQFYYVEAKKLGPELREDKIKNGFAALRTSYESLVIFDLFKGVVQRFNERVSVDSLSSVYFTTEIRDELLDSFYQCCRYMEGHLHSDKYAYKKPILENLNEEILRFNVIKKKISYLSKTTNKTLLTKVTMPN